MTIEMIEKWVTSFTCLDLMEKKKKKFLIFIYIYIFYIAF